MSEISLTHLLFPVLKTFTVLPDCKMLFTVGVALDALTSLKALLVLLAGAYAMYQVPSAIAKDYSLAFNTRLILHAAAFLLIT